MSPSGSPLLDIRYRSADVETVRCRLYGNGAFTKAMDSGEVVDRVLSADGVRRVKAALVTLDLPGQPAEICR